MTEIEDLKMLCYQCEQTCKPTGCTKIGVCTKDPQTSALQDLLVFGVATKPNICYCTLINYIFATLTNTNHNLSDLKGFLAEIAKSGNEEFLKYYKLFVTENKTSAALSPAHFKQKYGEDLNSICQMGIQGIKGAAAYADHCIRLQRAMKLDDAEIKAEATKLVDLLHYFIFEANMETALGKMLEVGGVNFKIMELLDSYNCQFNGTPELTAIPTKLVPGKCILVTGHDLVDLRTLLEKCEKEGINVYTHGEMLPAFSYPELKKFTCLKANYGNAWQLQQKELEHFPGPILFTTNCIMKPKPSYINNVYTTGIVGYEGCKHIANDNWDEIVKQALAMPGFADQAQCDEVFKQNGNAAITETAGFNHRVFDGLAGTLLQMLKDKKIKGFRFIGGCDGSDAKRNVFTKLAQECPADTVVLTGACGRYKVNHLEMGAIDGIPRLLDVGQCNDVYSAIIILVKLAKALDCGVNDLPVELYVSWYEQKATAIFLTLCHLGVKNVYLGPTAPVAVTPNVFKVLQEKFNLRIIQ